MGRAHLREHCNLLRARRTGFSHRGRSSHNSNCTGLRPFALPGPMLQGVSYVQVSGLVSYIRNIMPDDMGIPLLGYRALSGWGYADVQAVVNVAKIHRGFCLDASRRARDMLGLVDAVLYGGRIEGLGSDLVIWRSGIKRALYFLLFRSLTVSSCNIS